MARERLEIQNLPKSCNEVLVLVSLRGRRMHGYEIAQFLAEESGGAFTFQYGTLYPILHRLEKSGMLRGAWQQEGPRRKRKYYTLTARGGRYATEQIEAWKDFTRRFFRIAEELGG